MQLTFGNPPVAKLAPKQGFEQSAPFLLSLIHRTHMMGEENSLSDLPTGIVLHVPLGPGVLARDLDFLLRSHRDKDRVPVCPTEGSMGRLGAGA